jgi:hypothetical protein
MARPRSIRGDDLRRALAQEAARIMFEHGVDDYGFAKRKAAERLGAGEHAVLPKNSEIEAALAEYQRIFAHDTHPDTLIHQRDAAVEAMDLLAEFEPRLVGSVLSGTATPHQPIELHLFSDSIEAITIKLIDEHVRYRIAEHRVRMTADRTMQLPVIQFPVGDFLISAMIFTRDGIRQAPLSPVDGRPMRRATIGEVRELISKASPDAHDERPAATTRVWE